MLIIIIADDRARLRQQFGCGLGQDAGTCKLWIYIYIYIYMFTCHIYIYIYVCMYIMWISYIYIYIQSYVEPLSLSIYIYIHISCDIHTHTPTRKSYTNFQLCYLVIQICATNCLGHGHGYECHSPHIEFSETGVTVPSKGDPKRGIRNKGYF